MGLEHWLHQKIRGMSNHSESYSFFLANSQKNKCSRQYETTHFNSPLFLGGLRHALAFPSTEIENTVPTLLPGRSLGRVKP